MSFLLASHLDFGYASADGMLFQNITLQFSPGWTGIAGANGTGKTTLLKLLAGVLKPDRGSVSSSGLAVLCEQEIFSPPALLNDFFASRDSYAFRLRENLELSAGMAERWDTLSMGERKKLQIGCALFGRPGILCIDEPTNHLDNGGRDLLSGELQAFRGIGVIVSHDRELLDLLCSKCVFLEHGKAVVRSGGVSAGLAMAESEFETLLQEREQLKKELKRGKQELQRRREKEQQSRNKDNKKKLDRHDHDGKGKIDAARVSGRDRRQGDLAKQQLKSVGRTGDKIAELGKLKVQKYGLKISYGSYSAKNTLLEIGAETIALGGGKFLKIPELVIGKSDRIALSGGNGTGKSTLLRFLLPQLKIAEAEYLYMPQEFNAEAVSKIYRVLQSLSRDEFSKVMNVVASLGSRPERVLDSDRCSPGEWRKLFFGLGVLRNVHLIVMDEPTNHLDLPSIGCLEKALGDCECALLLVSHDRVFLRNLCPIHWHIEATEDQLKNVLKKYSCD